MNVRNDIINKIKNHTYWDIIVIGGGASGLGVALDATSRGLKTLLIEKEDFGSGTSSKSTKLVHGGVRYLAQGDISLVFEALKERAYILKNAAHLCDIQKFIIPAYSWFDAIKYLMGLMFYDLLSMHNSLGKTKWVSKNKMKDIFPKLKSNSLLGGIEYTDGRFDDSRLCIDLVTTISSHGGTCINYFELIDFIIENNKITGIKAIDKVTNTDYSIKANLVINATGVYAGKVMEKADSNNKLRIAPSQGSHLVSDKTISSSDYGLMIPKTSDGRVLFALPWKGKTLVGTTDIAQKQIDENPQASTEEIQFILDNLNEYCENDFSKEDISTTFAGLRPLAAPKEGLSKTKEISRSHKIIISPNGLCSLIGGKWTTFRKMGQDTIDKAIKRNLLQAKPSNSSNIKIKSAVSFEGQNPIHADLPYSLSDFENIIKSEYVESIDDLLSRRTRCTFISLKSTTEILPKIFEMIRTKCNWSDSRLQQDFNNFVNKYKFDKIKS